MKDSQKSTCTEMQEKAVKEQVEPQQIKNAKQMNKKPKDQRKEQEKAQQKVQQRYYSELAKYQEQIRKTRELTGKDRAA